MDDMTLEEDYVTILPPTVWYTPAVGGGLTLLAKHRIQHVHLDSGECVKNAHGPLCKNVKALATV